MNRESSEDLQFRILALLDGTLDEAEVARLDAEMRDSREARDLYRQLALLHIALKQQATAHTGLEQVPVIPIERLLARQRRRVLKASLLAAAAVLLVSALIFHFKMVQSATPVARFQVGPDTAFTLTHTGDDDAPLGNALAPGSRLQLTRGTMEGVFESGVRCVIEAPCDLTVLDDEWIAVAEGVAWFEVPPPAVGFTVETAQLTVVDLGTEFGVLARAGDGHEVHVITGSVEVTAAYGEEVGRSLTLKAGEARRMDRGEFREIPSERGRFATSLPEAIPVANASFELNRNPDPDGNYTEGERADFGGELTAWISQSGAPTKVHIGWRGTDAAELQPDAAKGERRSQVLSLISGASVLNVTGTPWSSLRAGDRLTLTVSLGMRDGSPALAWNEGTFFGLTDGSFSPSGIPVPADTVTHSGIIADNPATGNQSGDGTFRDVSIDYTVREGDVRRPGNIGILLVGQSSRLDDDRYQSFFDNVRLHLTEDTGTSPSRR